jgi:toxin-antitoxin system PIN domain toxin
LIIIDANLLIYAYDGLSADHEKARAWVEIVFSGSDAVGLPLQSIGAFLRVVTNRRLPGARLTLEQALQVVDEWLELPNVRLLLPTDGHWPVLRRMVLEGAASGALVSDAQLAALTVEYGGILCSADRDFARFPGLRWKNPIT